jgi:hypothetical protein
MNPSRRLSVIALIVAVLGALVPRAQAANVITILPPTLSFAEDVAAPGSGWTFDTAAAWFPAGWNGAYTYHTNGCVAAQVTTTGNASWTMTASYTTSPATSVNVAVAQAGTGACGTPASAGTPLSANSGSPTTLATGRASLTLDFYVVVQPTVAVTAPVAITITFAVSGNPVSTGALAITLSPGNAFAVTVTPSATSFAQDVTTPGAGWTFNTSAPWLPAGWNGAYTYGAGGCVAVQVQTSVQGWNLTAYYTTTPSTAINVAVAQAGTGSTCTTPGGAGTPVSTNSGSPTTLVAGQSGTQTINFYIIAQPTTALTSNVTITTTFTSQ